MTETKGQRTRQRVIQLAVPLFNRKGYAGVSMSDIIEATNLKKGGLYRHFDSKDDLALAAFDHAFQVVSNYLQQGMAEAPTPRARLETLISMFRNLASESPIVEGGCPVMNTAIDADDGHPTLRKRVREAMGHWLHLLEPVIAEGVDDGSFQPVAPDATAQYVIATLEGGLMLSKLYDDPTYLENVIGQLERYVETNLYST